MMAAVSKPGNAATAMARAAALAAAPIREGKLVESVGLVLEATGCAGAIGERYEFDGGTLAEVVGVRGDRTLLMPLGETLGLAAGARLRRRAGGGTVPVGDALLGRVLDGLGRPIDGGPPLRTDARWPLDHPPSHPLNRRPIDQPLATGVQAMDGLLTLGLGQRIGIFAGGGVGKSTLLASMVEQADCDVCVVALIGERGREVEELVHRTLGPIGLKRSVVIAATSADPPLARARGALHATAVAESFRAAGKRVLLVMDSVTRFAMALREVGLAAGEPPATKGYPPSVFAALPRLMERAGTCDGPGSITGIYTVLVEGDDLSDPIADAARAILDGHIVLRRELAERGHYPAIDVGASISRVMNHVTDEAHGALARRARQVSALAAEAEDLRAIGAYEPGTSPAHDEALAIAPTLRAFTQTIGEGNIESTVAALSEALNSAPGADS